ncbi:MAG: hypothetical protein LBP95_07450 [Deltaproteobacteria bacterium]|jgi:hypothetical protein|nr:hypothetical protein [Deltaproteobacteria bacterium]
MKAETAARRQVLTVYNYDDCEDDFSNEFKEPSFLSPAPPLQLLRQQKFRCHWRFWPSSPLSDNSPAGADQALAAAS